MTYQSRRRRRSGGIGPLFIVCTLAVGVAGYFGIWWAPLPAGFILGLLYGRGITAAQAALACLLGWALVLTLDQVEASIIRTSNVVAGIVGLSTHGGPAVIALTLFLAAVLAASGTWVGVAIRGLF